MMLIFGIHRAAESAIEQLACEAVIALRDLKFGAAFALAGLMTDIRDSAACDITPEFSNRAYSKTIRGAAKIGEAVRHMKQADREGDDVREAANMEIAELRAAIEDLEKARGFVQGGTSFAAALSDILELPWKDTVLGRAPKFNKALGRRISAERLVAFADKIIKAMQADG